MDCLGKTASECCTAFKEAMLAEGIPTIDANGHCISCFVHQQQLEPIIDLNGDGVSLLYVDQQYDTASSKCMNMTFTPGRVQTNDSEANVPLSMLQM